MVGLNSWFLHDGYPGFRSGEHTSIIDICN
jgi:hypothetical protein